MPGGGTSTSTGRVDTIMDGINLALDEFKGCIYDHLSNEELFPKSTHDAKRHCCTHKDALADFQYQFVKLSANCMKQISIAKKELKKIGRKMQELELEGEKESAPAPPNKVTGNQFEVQVPSPVSIPKEEEAQEVLRKFMKEEIYDDLIDEFICSFCNEIFLPPTVSAPCGHTYCDLCIMKWVKEKRTCPMCVNPLTEKDLRRNYYIEGVVEGLKPKVSSAKRSELTASESERRQERQKVKTILNLDENIAAPPIPMAQPEPLPPPVTVQQNQVRLPSPAYNNQNGPRAPIPVAGSNGNRTSVIIEAMHQNQVRLPSLAHNNQNGPRTPIPVAGSNGNRTSVIFEAMHQNQVRLPSLARTGPRTPSSASHRPPDRFAGNYGPTDGFAGNYGRPDRYAGNYGRPDRHAGNYGPPDRYAGNYGPPDRYAGNYGPPDRFAGNYGPPDRVTGNSRFRTSVSYEEAYYY